MVAKVSSVLKNSVAYNYDIRKNDEIISINGSQMSDYIDYAFLIADEKLIIKIKRDDEIFVLDIEKNYSDDLGIIFESAFFDNVKHCANNCIFCFVDQQPKGLRESLYIKDDDYRLSYLQGTYITLTNLTLKDKKRISKLRLGPLYVSVHTTNPELRCKMLNNKRAKDILKELDFLKDNDIPFHAQIVLCPGYNDGKELQNTLEDLIKYKNVLMSVAIVPVGLTKYRTTKLIPVSKDVAIKTIKIVDEFNKKINKQLICVSDEFFLISNKEIPDKKYYNKFGQIEDGVGALRLLTDDFKKVQKKLPPKLNEKKYLTFATSKAAEKTFKLFSDKLNEIENLQTNVIAVKSNFWGNTVNVAGLITAHDLINSLKNNNIHNVIISSILLRPYTTEFLDGLTVKDVENTLNVKLHVIHDNYSLKELPNILKNL